MTMDNDLDRIAIYLLKLDPHDSYKEPLEKEYQLYREIMESIPVDVNPPDRLSSSIYSLLQRLKNYVVFGTSNNPLVPLAPSMSEPITIEEKESLLKEVKTNSTFIVNRKPKIAILKGYLDSINYKDNPPNNIFATISLVINEYEKCKIYSNDLEQEIAKAKYLYIIRLIVDGDVEKATQMISELDSDMILFVHLHHKDSVNNLLGQDKAILANEMYHFLNEFQDNKINDIEFWKIMAQIENPEIDSILCDNRIKETIEENVPEVIEESKTKKRKFLAQYFSRTYESDTFIISFSPCDYVRITLKLFMDFKMVAKEYKKLIRKVSRINAVHGPNFKEVSIKIENYKKVHSYSLDDAIDIHRVLKDIYYYFDLNPYYRIVNLDMSSYSLGKTIIPERAFEHLPIKKVILPRFASLIESRAFFECKYLREVVFPEEHSLRRIGKEAFKNCESLKEVDLFEQILDKDGLGTECFGDCKNLEKVILSKYLEVIPEGCFESSELSNISLDGIVEIQKSAFAFCCFLERVERTLDLRIIRKEAFYKCENLKHFGFPCLCGEDEELVIEDEAFASSGLKKVYIDSEKLVMGEAVFEDTPLKKAVIYSEIKSLPEKIFKNCVELEEVKLPAFLESIEDSCFKGCKNLSKFELPKTIVRLGKDCFSGCVYLSEINVPDSLKYIGEDVFYNCPLNNETRQKIESI